MADEVGLSLLKKKLVTNQVVLTVGYDSVSAQIYIGEKTRDFYGRVVPKHAHGTFNLKEYTSSSKMMREGVGRLFDELVDKKLIVRRITIDVNHVRREEDIEDEVRQLSLFEGFNVEGENGVWQDDDIGEGDELMGYKKNKISQKTEFMKEKRANEAILAIKKRYGKNAILKGINFEDGATGRERNAQIGGHRA